MINEITTETNREPINEEEFRSDPEVARLYRCISEHNLRKEALFLLEEKMKEKKEQKKSVYNN